MNPGRVGAQSGLGPGPGWGPYGPIGPLWAHKGPYGPIKALMGPNPDRAPTREARDADVHFVCVHGVPPFGDEKRRTYHACHPGQRPQGTELVVNMESQLLPEYILEVRVTDDDAPLQKMRSVAEHFEHALPTDVLPLRRQDGKSHG